jgi:hypothetical protein
MIAAFSRGFETFINVRKHSEILEESIIIFGRFGEIDEL